MIAPPPWLYRTVARLADVLAKLRRRIIPAHYGIVELGTMSWVSQSVAAFCELGLPHALAHGPRTAQELAAQGYGDRDALFRLLRALAAYDVVEHAGGERFALGHLGKALTGNASAAPMLLYGNAPWHVAAYARLAQAIRQGRSGFELTEGKPMFAYFQEHPEAGALFDAAMQSLTPLFADAFALAYDFSGTPHVVDVGGGTGALLAAVLERYPSVRGTIFELPAVVARVRAIDRLAAVSGSILSDAPPQADAYIFSHILHDWDDESCVRMLQNVRRAMPPHARVLVYEIVAPPPNNWWSQDRITDLEMLAMLGGRERTREEFAQLLERAGLHLDRVIATGAPESILEATPRQG
ncbi:MAG TPA: methyltransferase [Candidatus Baltobacteraceae bacterium]|nr:methyltransferase [Candidatus Baltobacteraceae bacterium]